MSSSQMQVDGDGRTPAGVGSALLLAYSRKPQGWGSLGGGGAGGFSLSQSLSQNRDAAVGGKGRPSAEEYAREVREAYDAIEEPVDAIREIGEHHLQQLFGAMLLATKGPERQGERDDLLVTLGMACIEDASLVAGRRGKQVIDLVCNEIQHLHPDKCVLMMETLLNNISHDGESRVDKETNEKYVIEVDTRCFDMIPKLLLTISSAPSVKNPSKRQEDTGLEYQTHTIDQMIKISWPKRLTLAMADTIRYLRVKPCDVERCVDKMLKESRRLNKQDMPHLVYHILLLSSQGDRASILRKVLQQINEMDERVMVEIGGAGIDANLSQIEVVQSEVGTEDDMCVAEGTILQHFDFSVKQDQALGQDVIKILKQRNCHLTPFETALLLQMSTVQRYEAAAVQILRKAAEQDYTFQVKVKTSNWIAGISRLQEPSSIENAMKVVMKRTNMGWEHLVPAIVGFASTMLCTYAKRCLEGHLHGPDCKSVPQRIVHLGATLLEKAFTMHMSVRDEILSQILSHVITRDDVVAHFISLLSKISSRCSRDVMEKIPKIKDAVEYISYMPPKTAVAFLEALAPIMRIQTGLQDYIIIVLRKALFSRESEARIVALDCLLHLASSQVPSGAESGDRPGSSTGRVAPVHDDLTLDLIGQIRRCMVQQLPVRQRLYDGLCEMTHSKPAMLDTIAGIIRPHLGKYVIQGDNDSCELEVRRCMERGITLEPLPHLMRCALRCVHAHSEMLAAGGSGGAAALIGGDESLLKLRVMFEGISAFLADFDLEMLELDQIRPNNDAKCAANDARSQDFTDKAETVLKEARLWYGAYEVMLEHALLCQHVTVSHLDGRCRKLFAKMQKIESAIKPKGKGQTDLPPTLFTPEYTTLLLSCTKTQGDIRIEGKARIAAFANVDLVVHGLRTCCKQIQGLKSMVQDGVLRDVQAFAYIKRIAPILIRQFYANLQESRCVPVQASSVSKKREGVDDRTPKSVAAISLVGLQACLELICSRGTISQISEVAGEIVREIEECQCDEAILPEDSISQFRGFGRNIHSCLIRMESIIMRLLENDDREQVPRIFSCLMHLLKCLPMEERDSHSGWFVHLTRKIKGGKWSDAMIKEVASTYLLLSSGEKDLATAAKLSHDVRRLVGGDEDEEPDFIDLDHGILGSEEAESKAGISALCDYIKSCCDEADWTIAHVESMSRPDIGLDDTMSDDPCYVQASRDNNASDDEVMIRMHKLVLVLMPMADSALTLPRCVSDVVDALCRVYQSAEGAARRVLKSQTLPRERFSVLMKTIGSKLNEKMYASIDRFAKARNDDTGVNSRNGSKSQLSKEQKLVPNIIYFVESLEKHLIKISKKPKSIDLMRGFSRSTARDFKVDFDKITMPEERTKKGKKKQDGDGEDDQDGGKESGKKKRKSGKDKSKSEGGSSKRKKTT